MVGCHQGWPTVPDQDLPPALHWHSQWLANGDRDRYSPHWWWSLTKKHLHTLCFFLAPLNDWNNIRHSQLPNRHHAVLQCLNWCKEHQLVVSEEEEEEKKRVWEHVVDAGTYTIKNFSTFRGRVSWHVFSFLERCSCCHKTDQAVFCNGGQGLEIITDVRIKYGMLVKVSCVGGSLRSPVNIRFNNICESWQAISRDET